MQFTNVGRGLAIAGMGLGALELVAPAVVARLAGAGDSRESGVLVRALGAREVANGIGLLRARSIKPWIWGRVAGDAVDLALLGLVGRRNGFAGQTLRSLAFIGGITALDLLTAVQVSGRSDPRGVVRGEPGQPVRVEHIGGEYRVVAAANGTRGAATVR